MEFVFLAAGAAIGFVIAWLWMKSKGDSALSAATATIALKEQSIEELKSSMNSANTIFEQKLLAERSKSESLNSSLAYLKNENENLNKRLAEQKEELNELNQRFTKEF